MVFDLGKVSKELLTCREPQKGNNIITPISRMSFPNLFEARGIKGSDKKRFGVALLIPPQCNIDMLKKDATRAAQEKWGEKIPANLKTPFLKAETYEYSGYEAGWILIRANCNSAPTVLEPKGGSFIKLTQENSEEVYAGRWCIATLRAFAYDQQGNRGVSFGLNNVVLLDHDESLGGRMKAEDEFAPIADYTPTDGASPSAKTIDSLF